MKKKLFIIVVLPLCMVFIAFQSCTKDEGTYTIYQSFTTPVASAPLNGASVKITGSASTVDLKWLSTDKDGDTPLADVYFGDTGTPPLYKSVNSVLTVTVPVIVGGTYYWKVTMKDKNGIITKGPTWNFTVPDPLGILVGNYLCDEPAESYSYDVSFTKPGATTLMTTNYWNSGWTANFALDYTKLTYSMPMTTWGSYSGIESGTVNATTGKMVGNYIIYYKGKSIEEGVHTYTKK